MIVETWYQLSSTKPVPSNSGDHRDQLYLVPSNFCSWLSFFSWAPWEAYNVPQTSLLNLRGEGKKSRQGSGSNMDGTIMGDGEGTIEEYKDGGRHPPYVSSPSNYTAYGSPASTVLHDTPYTSLAPKQHPNRFSRFCRVHRCVQQTCRRIPDRRSPPLIIFTHHSTRQHNNQQ